MWTNGRGAKALMFVGLVAAVATAFALGSAAAPTMDRETEMAGRIDEAAALAANLSDLKKAATIGVRQAQKVRVSAPAPPIRTSGFADVQQIGLDFRTDVNVGETGGPAGIRMTPDEIAGYSSGTTMEFRIRSSDGKAEFAGGAIVLDDDGLNIIGDFQAINFRSTEGGTVHAFVSYVDSTKTLTIASPTGPLNIQGDDVRVFTGDLLSNTDGQDLGSSSGHWGALHTDDLFVYDLPTSDPSVAGQIWSDGGVLTVSAGP
jgi:hypothetical protein